MVVHLVHRDRDGKLAVVAVLLQAGASNRLIETLWKNVPKEKEKEQEVPGVQVNAAELLPANKAAYYTFAGSLTTPPCSEDVTWFVLKARTTISKDELASFGKLYPMNARPTQPLNGREIRATE
jgi:carbonic anhydrase